MAPAEPRPTRARRAPVERPERVEPVAEVRAADAGESAVVAGEDADVRRPRRVRTERGLRARLGVSRRVTRRLSRWKLLGRSRRIGHRIVLSGSWRTLSRRLACDISALTSWILLTMMAVSREVTAVATVVVTAGIAGIAVVTEVIVVVVAVDGRTVMVIRGASIPAAS